LKKEINMIILLKASRLQKLSINGIKKLTDCCNS
jgi:hypothetical protein